jgi:pre-mRNA-splicing factor ATP-dependent RNA helicase DHX38/PRP16
LLTHCFYTVFSVREQNFSERERRIADTEFSKRAEIELQMATDRERSARERAERLQAEKSVASTPRIAQVGAKTPRPTPRRRFGV